MRDDPFEEGRRRRAEAEQRRALKAQALARAEQARQRSRALMAETLARVERASQRRAERLLRERERFEKRMCGFRMPRKRRRGPDKDEESGGVPAVPDRPRDLSGGAAAELDFGDE